jgi:hypothetical protein
MKLQMLVGNTLIIYKGILKLDESGTWYLIACKVSQAIN